MKNEQIDLAKKGIQLAEEIINLTAKSKNQEIHTDDYAVIKHYFESNSSSEQLIRSLEEKEAALIRNEKKQTDIRELTAAIRKQNRVLRVRKSVIRYSSVAAALFAVSLLIWQTQKLDNTSLLTTENVTKPMLVIGSGENIDLTTQKTIITQNGYSVNKIESNKLSYAGNKETILHEIEYNTIIVPSMYTYNVVLEDGSEIKLNANSELRYPAKFTSDKREVFLKGEAYFRVAKSTTPFIVVTPEVNVKVYGTVFNINLHKEGVVETVLLSGSVGVETRNLKSNREVMIKPSEKFSLNIQKEEVTINHIDPKSEIVWIDNCFKCDATSLDELVADLSSWYGEEFRFTDNRDKEMKVTVTLSRDLKIDDLLSILEYTLDIRFIKLKTNAYEIITNSK